MMDTSTMARPSRVTKRRSSRAPDGRGTRARLGWGGGGASRAGGP